jgi:hypothetical protein
MYTVNELDYFKAIASVALRGVEPVLKEFFRVELRLNVETNCDVTGFLILSDGGRHEEVAIELNALFLRRHMPVFQINSACFLEEEMLLERAAAIWTVAMAMAIADTEKPQVVLTKSGETLRAEFSYGGRRFVANGVIDLEKAVDLLVAS